VRHGVDSDRPVISHPTGKPARNLHRPIAVRGEGLGATAAVHRLAVSDSAEESLAGSGCRAEWFDQIYLTPCQPRDLVADVGIDRGGRPGWPVDRNLYQLSLRTHPAEDLKQRLAVDRRQSLLTLRARAAGTGRSDHGGELPSRSAKLGFPEHRHAADLA
jgi:hypothetical protein